MIETFLARSVSCELLRADAHINGANLLMHLAKLPRRTSALTVHALAMIHGYPCLTHNELSDNIGYSQLGTHVLSDLDQVLEEPQNSTPTTCTPSFLGPNQWVDVKRHLDVLPRGQILVALIDVFFREANWYFAVLDRCFFDSMYLRWTAFRHDASTPSSSALLEILHFAALLSQLMALALQFLPPGHTCESSLGIRKQEKRDEMSERYSELGETLMNILGRLQPSITSVQADLMRCAWLKNDGRGTESWNSLGYAVRQAQELGLHLDNEHTVEACDTSAKDFTDLVVQ